MLESNRDGNWNIYLMDVSGTNEEQLTFNKGEDRRPTWHPNGKKILFESNRSGKNELHLIKLKNKKVRQISNLKDNGEPIFATFSPNGKFIATGLQASPNTSNLFLLNKKGKIIKQLTKEDSRNAYPKWSQKGDEIVYFSRKDTNNETDELYRLNLKTGIEVRLTNWPKHNFCPSWSNDGQKIAYVTSMEGTRPEIYIMDANGAYQLRITHNKDGDTLPNWSPNGDKLLITGYRNGNYQICELELKIEGK